MLVLSVIEASLTKTSSETSSLHCCKPPNLVYPTLFLHGRYVSWKRCKKVHATYVKWFLKKKKKKESKKTVQNETHITYIYIYILYRQ